VPPFGYLWCDGTQITTDSSTSGGDEKYRNLIEVLQGVNKNSTTGTQSAYLPNLVDCYALGGTVTDMTNISYNTANANLVSDSINEITYSHFPKHNHNSNAIDYSYTYDKNNNPINITVEKGELFYLNLPLGGEQYWTGRDYKSGELPREQGSRNFLRSDGGGENVMAANKNVAPTSNLIHHHKMETNQTNHTINYKYAKHNNFNFNPGDLTISNEGAGTSVNWQPKSHTLKAAIRYL